jgi:hypothetical protein
MRSSVVIRFRDGDDPGRAGSSRLGSGICAMLGSISIQRGRSSVESQCDNDNRFHYFLGQSIKELLTFVNPFFEV